MIDLETLKIQCIKASELKPGDMILIKCPKDITKNVEEWSKHVFPKGVRVGIVWESMEFEVIKDVRRGE